MPSWFQHVDLMNVVIVLLFSAFTWFCIRTLTKIDKNQDALFERVHNLEKEFYEMRGEHKARTEC